jgi:predicted metalloprotease with PDZ domain
MKMSKYNILFWILYTAQLLPAHGQSTYHSFTDAYKVYFDLNKIVNDRLQVEIIVPILSESEIEYQMPKIVPGTYAIYDFGRFVQDFKAFTGDDKELAVERIDDNRWKIKQANQLYRITYWVEDSFDTNKGNFIFEPAGTNIEAGKNILINTFGFVGYLEGYKDHKFYLVVKKPEDFYGSTALEFEATAPTEDVFSVSNYVNLADMPLMYCKPDTATFKVANAQVLVSVYSPNKKLTAAFVKENVRDILLAQKDYLGGTLPVNKYAFLIYLNAGIGRSGSFGALEHSYSTVFFFLESDPQSLAQTIKDVAAHEFFHIVTPLNIHSEEIGNYDFIHPKMSKHLWMYEGVTEYSAHHVQLRSNLISMQEFLAVMSEKIASTNEQFKDHLPFTEMSKGCLTIYEDQYPNVYEKGALIGLCLDIRLRELSNGAYGVQELMRDLAKEYGKEQSFKDDELFDKITSLTYPEIRTFFKLYVEGDKSLPLEETLKSVGIKYQPNATIRKASLGNIQLAVNPLNNHFMINKVNEMNAFGKEIGYQKGDELVSVNGVNINTDNYETEIKLNFQTNTIEGELVSVKLLRNGEIIEKTAKAVVVESKQKYFLELMPNATEEQLMIRKAWCGQ